MKSRKSSKSKKPKLLKRLLANKKRYLVAVVGLVILLAAGGLVFAKSRSSQKSLTSLPSSNPAAATLRIESSIPGITMKGEPHCDSVTLNKTTPYDCKLEEDQNETVIIAPAETIKDGKTYVFQAWDGCSEGNTDWKICKKVLVNNKTEKITATYGLKDKSVSPGGTPASSASPAGETYVPYIPNQTQCKDTTTLNASDNMGTCTVKIASSMRLFMGINWSPAGGTDEPRISIICNPAGDGKCTWSAYRDRSLKQTTFTPGTPYIINDEYQMGTNAINSNMTVEATATSTSQTLNNNWNIVFPINYSSGGQNFIFDSSESYDNWSGHGTLHDYYVTLKYKKVN